MADKTLKVTLSAKDDASATFKAVGDSAKSLGSELDKTGDDFSDFSQESEKATTSLKDIDKVGRDVALSIGIVTGALVLASKSYRDNQIALDVLDRSYGDASDSMRDFTQQIQDTTNFSNDQALAAANVAATLARNYAFTADEIQQVLTISADLAAANGVSLEDAAYRVTAALRGEAEGAEALGLTMNQAAIDSQNLTLTMSNQEAGHFRLNALIEQSAFAQGAAAQQADTFYGSLTQVKDVVQDMGQGLAGALGPIADLGAFAADNAITIAAMSVGMAQLGTTAVKTGQLLSGIAVGTTTLGAAAVSATPLVIGLAVGLGALYVGYQALIDKGDFLPGSFDDIAASAENVTQVLTLLKSAGDDVAFSLGTTAQKALDDFNESTLEIFRLSGEEATFQPGRANAEQQAVHDANMARLEELRSQYGNWTTSAEDVAAAEAALQGVLTDSGAGRDLALQGLQRLNDAYDAGTISPETYASGLEMLNGQLEAYDFMAEQATATTEKSTTAVQAYLDSLKAIPRDMSLPRTPDVPSVGAGVVSTVPAVIAGVRAETALLTHGIQDADLAIKDVTNSAAQYNDVFSAANAAAADGVGQQVAAMDALVAVREANAKAILEERAAHTAMVEALQTDMVSAFDAVTTAVTGTTKALDSGFQVVVGNTNAIAQASQGVADWATELINVQGEYGKMDDLLKQSEQDTRAAVITQEQYNAAQAAYTPIMEANTRIQDDMLSIQVQQAPVIAELAQQQADYLDTVTQMTPELQTYTLAMMDSATSAEALQLATSLLGENGAVFAPMVESAANLDPYLASILLQMGLIEAHTADDGTVTYTVTLDDQASSPMADLTAQMGDLTDAVYILTTYLDDDATNDGLTQLEQQLIGVDTFVATPTVNLSDGASGPLSSIRGQLDSLYDKTIYVNTVYTSSGTNIGAFGYSERHGGVPGFAHGGVVAELAEAGPEMLHFANGGMLPVMDHGIYGLPTGTYVSPNNATGNSPGGQNVTINVTVQGSMLHTEDFKEQLTGEIADAWVRGMRTQERGVGW